MPLKQGSNALVTKLPFQAQDKPALGTARLEAFFHSTLGLPTITWVLKVRRFNSPFGNFCSEELRKSALKVG